VVNSSKPILVNGSEPIDNPDTRHIRQNVYLREVSKQDGKLINKEIQTFEAQPDWGQSAIDARGRSRWSLVSSERGCDWRVGPDGSYNA
jgi:hypothetical protein